MKCKTCGKENVTKVIAFGLPMRLCFDCGELTGIFSWLYAYVLMPIEVFFTGQEYTAFMGYECSYPKALWHWLTANPEDDE